MLLQVGIRLLLSVVLASSGCSKWDQLYGEVLYANIFFRHGIRAPTVIAPNDPHISRTSTLWPNGLGELTREGAHQHFQLGRWLRKRYEHLLPPIGAYNRSAIYVLSSDKDRCQMSATANMAGMFPKFFDKNLGGLHWPPVPVHTIPPQYDNIIGLTRKCKKYEEEFKNFLKTEDYQHLVGRFKDIIDFTAYVSGLNMTVESPKEFDALYMTLAIEELYGLSLPRWAREIYPDKMTELTGNLFALRVYTPELQRLRIGNTLRLILTTMENKLNGKLQPPTQNITVYSGHDTTLSPILHSLGVYNFLAPPFCSALLIELRQKPDALQGPVVTIFYRNTTNKEPFLLKIPSCSEACPLSRFREIISPLLVNNWDSECEN